MKSKYADVWRALDGVSGYVRQSELPNVLLADISQSMGMELEHSGLASNALMSLRENDDGYYALQEARSRFLAIPNSEKLAAIDEMMGVYQSRETGFWIGYLPAKRITELAGTPGTVRCAFTSSLHPALMMASKGSTVRFVDRHSEVCDMAKMMAFILKVPLQVVMAEPFNRVADEAYDAEIIMAPFGSKIHSSAELSLEALDILGRDDGPRRLSGEAVALADAQVSPTDTVIVSVASSAMFRGVGVEPIAREALVESGRLKAILSVPAGMLFHASSIASDILVLGPKRSASDTVRFVNLGSPQFAGKTVRGRPEVKPESSWLEAISHPSHQDDEAIAEASISEIRDKDYILSLDRYVIPPAVAALERFLDNRETLPLAEVVELIRPVSIGKGDEGDVIIREAAPADIGDNDFLPLPKKELLLDRPQLRKARAQRLQPGDVILSVKGTIGTAALVPSDVPMENDSHFWTAGQSFMILRPKKGKVSGVALLEFLSSDAVKTSLRSLAVGAAIQTIAIKDLKEFQVPVPSDEENAAIEAAFQKRQDKRAQVRLLLEDIDRERDASWPHDALQGWQSHA